MGAVVCGKKREPKWCNLRRLGAMSSPINGKGSTVLGGGGGGVIGVVRSV